MRRWRSEISDVVLWFIVPLVVAPTVLATTAPLLFPSFLPQVSPGQPRLLPLWLPPLGAVVALGLLIAAGRHPRTVWVSRIYPVLAGGALGILVDRMLPAGAWPAGLLPVAFAVALPRVVRWISDWTLQGRSRRVQDSAVVCVAGMRSSQSVWTGLLPILQLRGPTKTLALPGFGFTSKPRERMALMDQIDWLDRQVGRGPSLLVGHSYGGHLALRYASEHPDKVCGLVLIAPALLRVGEGSDHYPRIAMPAIVPWLERKAVDVADLTLQARICLAMAAATPSCHR